MSSWQPRTTRNGIEYGGASSHYFWDYPPNINAQYWYWYPYQGAQNAFIADTYEEALPNCTCYARGRILEAGDPSPVTGNHSANAWHSHLANGWTAIPWNINNVEPGDILEWCSNGRNHVAVVEAINGGIPMISQSYYTGDNGGGGNRTGAYGWGNTKQSVSDYGIAHYGNNYGSGQGRFFSYMAYTHPYNAVPDYILKNPVDHSDTMFKWLLYRNSGKRKRRKVLINV